MGVGRKYVHKDQTWALCLVEMHGYVAFGLAGVALGALTSAFASSRRSGYCATALDTAAPLCLLIAPLAGEYFAHHGQLKG